MLSALIAPLELRSIATHMCAGVPVARHRRTLLSLTTNFAANNCTPQKYLIDSSRFDIVSLSCGGANLARRIRLCKRQMSVKFRLHPAAIRANVARIGLFWRDYWRIYVRTKTRGFARLVVPAFRQALKQRGDCARPDVFGEGVVRVSGSANSLQWCTTIDEAKAWCESHHQKTFKENLA